MPPPTGKVAQRPVRPSQTAAPKRADPKPPPEPAKRGRPFDLRGEAPTSHQAIEGLELIMIVPDPPIHLREKGREAWHEFCKLQIRRGALRPEYLWSVTTLCELIQHKFSIEEDLGMSGNILATGRQGTPTSNPLIKEMIKIQYSICEILESWGMTPQSAKRAYIPSAPANGGTESNTGAKGMFSKLPENQDEMFRPILAFTAPSQKET